MGDLGLERGWSGPGRLAGWPFPLTAVRQVAWTTLAVLSVFASMAELAHAQTGEPDLLDLPFEELMNVRVTSASKKSERMQMVPAAVYVVTAEDIRRSGVTNIPDALRSVPGLEVARIDANKWAISSRGFNGRYANKMLVLIDGRTEYSTIFSGVLWESQNFLMQNIDRIEVVRGPGAAVWGVNAVNGIINIITKPAIETQGLLLAGGAGSEERGFVDASYGVEGTENLHARVEARYFDRDNGHGGDGWRDPDAWTAYHFGMRLDWAPRPNDHVSIQGFVRGSTIHEVAVLPQLSDPYREYVAGQRPNEGESGAVRWTHDMQERGDLQLQAYYERTNLELPGIVEVESHLFGAEAVQRLVLTGSQELVLGMEYRVLSDEAKNSFAIEFDPASSTSGLWSGFAQHEWTWKEETLKVQLGSRVEHLESIGWQVQPSARLSLQPHPLHVFWTGVSRGVRSPSRIEDGATFRAEVVPPDPRSPGAPPTVIALTSTDSDPETVNAYEFGYRAVVTNEVSLDLAIFQNEFQHLLNTETSLPKLATYDDQMIAVLPLQVANDLEAMSRGIELSLDAHLHAALRTTGGVALLETEVTDPTHRATPGEAESMASTSPKRRLFARASIDLTPRLQVDLGVRHVGALGSKLGVDAYTVGDFRIGWKWNSYLSTDLVGRDIGPSHDEFNHDFLMTVETDVQPSVYLRAELRTW
ncbi:MAG: TonB-dependent receptor [Candidatus Eisenbacteria bacterium]